jgi:hypothetical protein
LEVSESSTSLTGESHVRDLDTIDSELQLVAALRRAARERGGPLPSIGVADALLDERRQLTELAMSLSKQRPRQRSQRF